MKDVFLPARRVDFKLREIVEEIISSKASPADKRAALMSAGLSLERAFEITGGWKV